MTSVTDPKSGIQHGWADNEDNWGAGMNSNLELLSRLGTSLVAEAIQATPHPTPVDGSTFIVAANGNGAWAGHDNAIAYYDGAAWKFYQVPAGRVAPVGTAAAYKDYRFSGTAWVLADQDTSAGGATTTIVTVTASRDLAATDKDAWLRSTSATAITLTVPAGSVFAIGDSVSGVQVAAGKIAIAPASGVTVHFPAGSTGHTRAVGSSWALIKVGANEWDLFGDVVDA